MVMHARGMRIHCMLPELANSSQQVVAESQAPAMVPRGVASIKPCTARFTDRSHAAWAVSWDTASTTRLVMDAHISHNMHNLETQGTHSSQRNVRCAQQPSSQNQTLLGTLQPCRQA